MNVYTILVDVFHQSSNKQSLPSSTLKPTTNKYLCEHCEHRDHYEPHHHLSLLEEAEQTEYKPMITKLHETTDKMLT